MTPSDISSLSEPLVASPAQESCVSEPSYVLLDSFSPPVPSPVSIFESQELVDPCQRRCNVETVFLQLGKGHFEAI
ncbi:hypothetical protein F2Q69_00031917 [Brassica cretica]|uniref:Uncharacterized protein n=1 Tax=Brassica cretica TaxID=69181 RepID=A0A8S9SCF3_BRACR|nr:hypothetical protein F2Q69_00031917 [Brassica cretica]